jgi:hypothetical protein
MFMVSRLVLMAAGVALALVNGQLAIETTLTWIFI